MGNGTSSDPKLVKAYFDNKVVWITGASSGLGEALAVALCRLAQPKALILSARRQAELERVKRHCEDLQPTTQIAVLLLDLSKLDTLAPAAEQAMKSFGQIDVLVNNGGVGFRGLGSETPLSVDQQVMNVDYFSGVALVKSLLPGWLEKQSGHVVQISSVQGFFGLPGRTAYSAAKHAIMGFYDSLRAEVSDFGIAITTVCPGYIATNHSQNAVHGSVGGYPEGHTSKGVQPEVLAAQVLTAAARRWPEITPAALDARLASVIRALCSSLLFWIMRKRAKKERQQMNK